jgi:hypothetical protein
MLLTIRINISTHLSDELIQSTGNGTFEFPDGQSLLGYLLLWAEPLMIVGFSMELYYSITYKANDRFGKGYKFEIQLDVIRWFI